MVYLREAHATDGWKKPNSQLKDPLTQVERDFVAGQCCQALKFEFPAVVDTIDDQTAVDWAAWPERIFVIGVDGRVAYAGEQGPWGFWPTERVKRQAARKKADNEKSGATGEVDQGKSAKHKADQRPEASSKNAEAPPRNFRGDSLEKFLTRLLPGPGVPEIVEPRAAPGN